VSVLRSHSDPSTSASAIAQFSLFVSRFPLAASRARLARRAGGVVSSQASALLARNPVSRSEIGRIAGRRMAPRSSAAWTLRRLRPHLEAGRRERRGIRPRFRSQQLFTLPEKIAPPRPPLAGGGRRPVSPAGHPGTRRPPGL